MVAKTLVNFQNALTAKAISDDEDSDASYFIEPFQYIDIPNPEIIKMVPFYKALPNYFPLTLGFATSSQKYKELRCLCSKETKRWSNKYELESIGCLRPQTYIPQGMLQHVSAI